MNKRQKKKNLKKYLIKNGYSDEKGNVYCINCGKKVSLSDAWSFTQACDSWCYRRAIGVYLKKKKKN